MKSNLSSPSSRVHRFPPVPVNPQLQMALDRAIDSVVSHCFLNQGLGRCACYAVVGAEVLSSVLGHPYHAVCGGEIIDCGNGVYVSMFPERDIRRRAIHISELREYHCWIQSWRNLPGLGRELEIVDFTTRHDQLTATHFGVEFSRRFVPKFAWDWAERIESSFPECLITNPQMAGRPKKWYWDDKNCTRLLQQWARAEPEIQRTLIPASLDVLSQLICHTHADLLAQEFAAATPRYLN